MLEKLRQSLLLLEEMHRRVAAENDVFTAFFSKPRLTWADLEAARQALERELPGFYVWYLEKEGRYALVPKTVKEFHA